MEERQNFRSMVVRMSGTSQPEKHGWFKFRESMTTMILGTLSTSVGVVVLIVGLMGVLGFGHGEWQDFLTGEALPSIRFGIAAIVGEGLGLAGLAIGKIRGDTISPLSAVGTSVCLIQMYLFFGRFILMQII